MFCPSLHCESSACSCGSSLPVTTMASADFLVCRNTESSPRPPQVRAYSFFRCLPDLLFRFKVIGTSACCVALSNLIASYQVSVPRIRFGAGCQYRSLQSRFLHCMGHPKRSCGLLTVRSLTSVRKRLSLSGIFQTTLPDLSEKFVFFQFIQSIQ